MTQDGGVTGRFFNVIRKLYSFSYVTPVLETACDKLEKLKLNEWYC